MIRRVKISIFQLVLLTVLLAGLPLPVAAATPVKVTAIDGGTVGRLVVDWGREEPFSTEIEGGYLYIRFTKPFDADLGPASRILAEYVGPGEFLEGRQSIRFPLKGDYQLASKKRGNDIILELRKARTVQTAANASASE